MVLLFYSNTTNVKVKQILVSGKTYSAPDSNTTNVKVKPTYELFNNGIGFTFKYNQC